MSGVTTEQTAADPGLRPMRADASRNRARLVEAARAAFTARGSNATVEEMAKAADVGVGTLYRHFPRRIDLVEAVYREDVDELVAQADVLVDEHAIPGTGWWRGWRRSSATPRPSAPSSPSCTRPSRRAPTSPCSRARRSPPRPAQC